MNGLKVSVSESDFKAKPVPDQNWMLYQAIVKIDEQGCSWASNHYKDSYWKKLTVFGAGAGGGIGFVFMAGKIFKLW